MKLIGLLATLTPSLVFSQLIQYSPNRKLEMVVDKNYYNTDFIYIRNIGDNAVNLHFEMIDNTFDPDWHASMCTNVQCFNSIPHSGSFGTLTGDNEAYFSFNFAANETTGEGQVRFLISGETDSEISDTVTFKYTVTEDGTVKARPWATIAYSYGVMHVFLENPAIKTSMHVVCRNGKSIFSEMNLQPITSVPLRDFPIGIYIVVIQDEKGRVITRKVARQ